MSDELKPCPFCGGDAGIISGKPNPRTGRKTYWRVYCTDCQSRTFTFKTRRSAVAIWNERWEQPAEQERPQAAPVVPEDERTCRWKKLYGCARDPGDILYTDGHGEDHKFYQRRPETCGTCGGKIVEPDDYWPSQGRKMVGEE